MVILSGRHDSVLWENRGVVDTHFKNCIFNKCTFSNITFRRCYFENVIFKDGWFFGSFENCFGVEDIKRVNMADTAVLYQSDVDFDYFK